MVEVRIIMEGGTPSENADVTTLDNSESLRQSLNRIFSKALNENISIKIDLGAGYKAAALKFAEQSEDNCFIYVDLDDERENIGNWFTKIENGSNPAILTDSHKNRVFFMIQEMEAWILKQPEAIELWAENNSYVRVRLEEQLTDHQILHGRDVEDIEKPSDKLGVLIRTFYQKQSSGAIKSKKEIKVRYGKLTTAPELLDCLDVDKLKRTDTEFNRFVSVVSQR